MVASIQIYDQSGKEIYHSSKDKVARLWKTLRYDVGQWPYMEDRIAVPELKRGRHFCLPIGWHTGQGAPTMFYGIIEDGYLTVKNNNNYGPWHINVPFEINLLESI